MQQVSLLLGVKESVSIKNAGRVNYNVLGWQEKQGKVLNLVTDVTGDIF